MPVPFALLAVAAHLVRPGPGNPGGARHPLPADPRGLVLPGVAAQRDRALRRRGQPRTRSISSPFISALTEITNAQYGRFLKATGYKTPLYWKDKNLNGPNQPVVGVTWHDAVAFCRWLTKVTGAPHELPTEDQWEAAARGGLVGQPYPWGDQAPDAGGVFRANFRTLSPRGERVSLHRAGGLAFPPTATASSIWPATSPSGARTATCPSPPAARSSPGSYASSRAAPGSPGPGTCAPPPASPPRPNMPTAISAFGWCVCPIPDPIFFLNLPHFILP